MKVAEAAWLELREASRVSSRSHLVGRARVRPPEHPLALLLLGGVGVDGGSASGAGEVLLLSLRSLQELAESPSEWSAY